jgi:hypothetical protein
MAVLGKKSAPTNQGCCLYQLPAFAAGHILDWAKLFMLKQNNKIVREFFILKF